MYEFEDGREVIEDTDISPTGMSGATMRRGEKLIASLQGTSLRLGGIYGAGRHWLVRAVLEGERREARRAAVYQSNSPR